MKKPVVSDQELRAKMDVVAKLAQGELERRGVKVGGPNRPRDPNQLAKMMVDIASGDAEPKETVASAVKGGNARAASLTPRQRAEIAKLAAEARWKKS